MKINHFYIYKIATSLKTYAEISSSAITRHSYSNIVFCSLFRDCTLLRPCVPWPAAIIASMSFSCGAAHADDVSVRWRVEDLDEDNRDQLGGAIYWPWKTRALS